MRIAAPAAAQAARARPRPEHRHAACLWALPLPVSLQAGYLRQQLVPRIDRPLEFQHAPKRALQSLYSALILQQYYVVISRTATISQTRNEAKCQIVLAPEIHLVHFSEIRHIGHHFTVYSISVAPSELVRIP